MIKTFADKGTQELYATGKSRRLPPDIARRATRKLEYIDLATRCIALGILDTGMKVVHPAASTKPLNRFSVPLLPDPL